MGLKEQLLKKLAGKVPKEDFLSQLEVEWTRLYKEGKVAMRSEEEVLKEVKKRMGNSGLGEVFDKVGVTQEDIREVIRKVMSK